MQAVKNPEIERFNKNALDFRTRTTKINKDECCDDDDIDADSRQSIYEMNDLLGLSNRDFY